MMTEVSEIVDFVCLFESIETIPIVQTRWRARRKFAHKDVFES